MRENPSPLCQASLHDLSGFSLIIKTTRKKRARLTIDPSATILSSRSYWKQDLNLVVSKRATFLSRKLWTRDMSPRIIHGKNVYALDLGNRRCLEAHCILSHRKQAGTWKQV